MIIEGQHYINQKVAKVFSIEVGMSLLLVFECLSVGRRTDGALGCLDKLAFALQLVVIEIKNKTAHLMKALQQVL